jgi:hypothetical protein
MPIETFPLERQTIENMKRRAASAMRNAGQLTSRALRFTLPISRFYIPMAAIAEGILLERAQANGWRSFIVNENDVVAAADFVVIEGEIRLASLISARTARRQVEALIVAENAAGTYEAQAILISTGQLGFSAVSAEIGERVLIVPISVPRTAPLERLGVYEEGEIVRALERPAKRHFVTRPSTPS